MFLFDTRGNAFLRGNKLGMQQSHLSSLDYVGHKRGEGITTLSLQLMWQEQEAF